MHDCDCDFARGWRDVCAAFHSTLRCFGRGASWVEEIAEESRHVWSFSQVKWIACVVDVIVACSTSRQTESGDESMWGECTSRVLAVERCGHDLSAGDGANVASP